MSNFLTSLFKKASPSGASTPAPTASVDTRVVSVEVSAFGAVYAAMPRVNPDSLVGRKSLSVYATMRLDEQVKAVTVFKRDAILSRGYTFEYDAESKLSDTEKDTRIRVFQQIIQRMPGSFVDALNVISTGREFGFSLTEKIYQLIDVDGKDWVGLRALRGRDPQSFEFKTDVHGDLESLTQVTAGQRIVLDIEKFIHYVHNPEFDLYFGRSDLREAYRSWYFKDTLIKYWGLYMEKLGGGLVVAKLSADSQISAGTTQYRDMQSAIANMKATASILAPQGVDIEIHFPTSTDAYEKACIYHDLAIAKALLVPNLMGVSNTGETGAYSQSQTQLEAFAWTISADTERLESCINEQLFRDLGAQNWGDDAYPQFKFKPLDTAKLQWLVTTWKELLGAGAVLATEDDEARLREILEMPPRDETTPLLVDPAAEAQAERDHELALANVEANAAKQPPPAPGQQAKASPAPTDKKPAPPVKAARDAKADARADTRRRATQRTLEQACERCDFAVIDRRQALLTDTLRTDLAAHVARVTRKVLGDDEQLALLTDQDVADIASVEFSGVDVGRMKSLTQKALADAWALGRTHAVNEVRRAGSKALNVRDSARFADLRDKAAGFFEANSFRMAGNVADGARAVIQQELQNSVKYGRSPGQTREAIWSRLVSKGFSSREAVRSAETEEGVLRALDALWLDDEGEAAHYLDTLARTNLFEAMNEARYAEFTDPAMDGFVVALRYSAILDQRTTEICEELHGAVFGIDSELWDEYRPPNHYNCRSVLIPITVIDVQDGEWNGQESEPPGIEPQEGFK